MTARAERFAASNEGAEAGPARLATRLRWARASSAKTMEETDGDVLTLVEGEYDEVVLEDGAFRARAAAAAASALFARGGRGRGSI